MSKSSSTVVLAATKAKKCNVERYLQQRSNISPYIAAVMRKMYSTEFHTLAEWDAIVEKLLTTKTK